MSEEPRNGVGVHGMAVNQHVCDLHRRGEAAQPKPRRVDDREPASRRKPECSVIEPQAARLATACSRTEQTILKAPAKRVQSGELAGEKRAELAPGHTRDFTVPAKPQVPALTFENVQNRVRNQPIPGAQVGKVPAVPVEKTFVSTDPEITSRFLMDGQHGI